MNFTLVPTGGMTAMVNGTYLSYSVDASGAVTTSPDQSNQSIIDAVNANTGASTPLSDILYFEVSDGSGNTSVYEVVNNLGDVIFQTPAAAPYTSPETVASGTTTDISGVTVTKGLTSGQTDNSGDTLTVSANVFDFTRQASDGQLSIDPTVAGGGGSVTYSADHGTVTIDGTIGQINADLSTLTYTAVNSGTDAIIIYATDSPDPTANQIVGNITVGTPTAMPVTNTNTTIFEVQPGIGSGQLLPGVATGDTVTGISTDDVNFTIVPMDGTQATVNGAYLSFSTDDLGNASIFQAQASQTLIDAINANDGSSTPLTDPLYYEVQDSSGSTTVDQYTFDLGDTGFTAPSTKPYSLPSTLDQGDTLAIGGAMVTKELSADGTYGGVAASAYTLSVSIGVFDFNRQAADGTVSIDPAISGGGGGTVTYGSNHGSVTIVGTIAEINADLSTLSYTAVQAGTDYIDISDIDGPTPNANEIIGSITVESVACYCRGTLILTLRGEVAVEDLQISDVVVTFAGTGAPLKPIRWLSHRRIDLRRHPDPENTHPIRFRAGSLGEGCPHRDLLVSPGHRMRINDVLVTALELVNGASIAQESPDHAEYWHIELDGHDIILADGVQAETYVDTGNRSAFENAAVVALNPVLDDDVPEPCLPYAGASVAIRAGLIARAEGLGWSRAIDPTPWLDVDGERIKPVRHGAHWRFIIPAGSRSVRLRSRSERPWDVDPHSGDRRSLGVKLHHLALGNPRGARKVALDSPHLSQGFERVEHDETGGTWRWTDGDALLPLAKLAPRRTVTVVEIAFDQVLPMWVAPAGCAHTELIGADIKQVRYPHSASRAA